MPPGIGPHKFQERPSGASRMPENLLAAWAPPRTPLGELTALPRFHVADGKGASCMPAPHSQEPHSALSPLGLRAPALALTASARHENRRLCPSQHDGLQIRRCMSADNHWMNRSRCRLGCGLLGANSHISDGSRCPVGRVTWRRLRDMCHEHWTHRDFTLA